MYKQQGIRLRNNNSIETVLACFCLLVFSGSLFFPLLDKDAAHHACIALHMLETGDYASLVDRGKDYLDKPHFLFWVSAASFKVFGINSFAHRFPAVIFALISVFSTYQLTKYLAGRATARMATIILATAQGLIISITDARMETPLTAAVIFGLWQMILYADRQRLLNLVLAALGVAIAFSTKGWLGPVVVFIAFFFRTALNRQWRVFASWKTWLFIPLFFLFISPVLYAYYLQYDLHPEKVIRGRSHISGVRFILWGQLFERYKGFDEGGRYSSPLFLVQNFLWAFFPWCIASFLGIAYWFRRMWGRKKWGHPLNFATFAFTFILVTISFSKFKMPHYIFMLFPIAAMFTAPYLLAALSSRRGVRLFFPLQLVFICFSALLAIALNYYFFKPVGWAGWVVGPLLFILLAGIVFGRMLKKPQKVIYGSAAASIFFNFLLNFNFFPQLLKYQAGNEIAGVMSEKNIQIPDEKIMLLETNAHSFDFARKYNHPVLVYEELPGKYTAIKDNYFMISRWYIDDLRKKGYRIEPAVACLDYNIATVKIKFLIPATRYKTLDTLMLARIIKP